MFRPLFGWMTMGLPRRAAAERGEPLSSLVVDPERDSGDAELEKDLDESSDEEGNAGASSSRARQTSWNADSLRAASSPQNSR